MENKQNLYVAQIVLRGKVEGITNDLVRKALNEQSMTRQISKPGNSKEKVTLNIELVAWMIYPLQQKGLHDTYIYEDAF